MYDDILESLPLEIILLLVSPPGVADFLFVGVDDVLHQQVPLKAVDAVAVQHHIVSAGRAAETAAVHQHGGPSMEQRRLDRK